MINTAIKGSFDIGQQALSDKNAWDRLNNSNNFTSSFTNTMMDRAASSLKAAGLPDYTLYTGGVMPGTQSFTPGRSSLTYIPVGSSSQWWTSAPFTRRNV